MYATIFWLLAIGGGIWQIFAAVNGKNKLRRLLPMLVWGAVMAATLVLGITVGSLGLAAALVLLWNEVKVLLVMAGAYGLVELVRFAKK